MWCRGWCGANGKNSCDVGCGVGCVEKKLCDVGCGVGSVEKIRVMWGVVWGVTFECFCRPLYYSNHINN